MNFTPFPNLTTQRLILRQMKIEDENEIFFLRSDERILEYTEIPKAVTVDDARKFIEKINNGIPKNEWVFWGITLKNDDKLIGTICLWNISEDRLTTDIGYVLHPDFHGRGVMQEAIREVIKYGFETMRVNTINADVDPNNSKSILLLERNGFVLSRKSKNTVIYSLLNSAGRVLRTS
ncbi:MAG TPA: GNAT family N-acetyltransferase [Chitinophagales bacterium]|nr:GNAT family N-acetyltransferase [Chitinophagales bacterium]